jgi:hypothetical protein
MRIVSGRITGGAGVSASAETLSLRPSKYYGAALLQARSRDTSHVI